MRVVLDVEEGKDTNSIRHQLGLIFEEVAKGLLSIPFGPTPSQTPQREKPEWLHYCHSCDSYHAPKAK